MSHIKILVAQFARMIIRTAKREVLQESVFSWIEDVEDADVRVESRRGCLEDSKVTVRGGINIRVRRTEKRHTVLDLPEVDGTRLEADITEVPPNCAFATCWKLSRIMFNNMLHWNDVSPSRAPFKTPLHNRNVTNLGECCYLQRVLHII